MSAQGYYEDKLEEAAQDLLQYYLSGGGTTWTREKAFGALKEKMSEIIEELERRVPND